MKSEYLKVFLDQRILFVFFEDYLLVGHLFNDHGDGLQNQSNPISDNLL